MAAGSGGLDTIAVSVHGPAGVVDLVVPPGAAAVDLAREYAAQATLTAIPLIYTRTGEPLRPDLALADAGVESGDVLVATTTVHRPSAPVTHRGEPTDRPPHPWTPAWFWAAGVLAVLAGGLAAGTDGDLRAVTVGLLAAAWVVGVVPTGRYTTQRALVAPAFGAAAAVPVLWDPTPERLPLVLGMVGLAAAVSAAVARALAPGPDEALRVWMVGGAGLFVLANLAALAGFSPAVVWSVALVVCVVAARFVPMYAVEVADQYLIDLERLAVTAWSARERRTGRRGRIVVPETTVARVASSAARTMTAAAAAIAVAAALSSYLLLTRVQPELDRIGVRCLVFFAGAALLLTARSHRHTGPRVLLRIAGLVCWAGLSWQLLAELSEPRLVALLGTAIALGLLLMLVAVATGRGWRSVWWSRRAEVAEGFCAAAALASVVVSSGLFRTLWEIAP